MSMGINHGKCPDSYQYQKQIKGNYFVHIDAVLGLGLHFTKDFKIYEMGYRKYELVITYT